MATAERFRSALRRLGLTTKEAAEKLGCDRSFVSLLQLGRARPGLEMAVAIEHMTMDLAPGPIRPRDWVDLAPAARARRASASAA